MSLCFAHSSANPVTHVTEGLALQQPPKHSTVQCTPSLCCLAYAAGIWVVDVSRCYVFVSACACASTCCRRGLAWYQFGKSFVTPLFHGHFWFTSLRTRFLRLDHFRYHIRYSHILISRTG